MKTAVTALGAAACGRTREYVVGSSTARASAWRSAEPPPPLAPSSSARASLVCTPTEDNIEGPFFKPGAPERVVLADERTEGTRLTLSGRVLDVRCAPIAGARIEVWHADHAGAYDDAGFGFRAQLLCDEEGTFVLETIVPGRYLNGARYRPAHVHVKIASPGFAALTTQLYFEGDPYNAGDPFIRPSLVMPLSDTPWGKAAAYDLVLRGRG